MRRLLSVAMCTSVLVLWAAVSSAQEPRFEAFQDTFQKDTFRLGLLVQVLADFQDERSGSDENGFSVANMRLRLSGTLDQQIGYLFQTNFIRSPAILDAKVSYAYAPELRLDAGLFKSPFSAEFLIGAADIDFVNRSQVVTALAPGRQIGVQTSGRTGKDRLSYAVGIFNGNQFDGNTNDNNQYLYAGRVVVLLWRASDEHRVEWGANVASSRDDNVVLGSGLFPLGFSGDRLLGGTDLRLVAGPILLSGELIAARLQEQAGLTHRPLGYHATTGYMIGPRSQVLLRWDVLHADQLADASRLVIVGLNIWPTRVTELQVNYALPAEGGGTDRNRLLINAQVSF